MARHGGLVPARACPLARRRASQLSQGRASGLALRTACLQELGLPPVGNVLTVKLTLIDRGILKLK